jgi:hypothetical protein
MAEAIDSRLRQTQQMQIDPTRLAVSPGLLNHCADDAKGLTTFLHAWPVKPE